jgi:hypothetical protein
MLVDQNAGKFPEKFGKISGKNGFLQKPFFLEILNESQFSQFF